MGWSKLQPRLQLSPGRIPQSPSHKSGDTPKLRTSQTTDSSLMRSITSKMMRVPNLIQPIYAKIAQLGRIHVVNIVPEEISKYEQKYLQQVINKGNESIEALDEQIPFQYEDKQMLETSFPEYYDHISLNNFQATMSLNEIYVQEVLGLPKILKNIILSKFLPDNYSTFELSKLYQQLEKYHPEQRIYKLFNGQLTYEDVFNICLMVVQNHKEYQFVQPEIYQLSLARATAARIFYDADLDGRWVLTYEETYLKRGFSILKQIFYVQNLTDINNIDSYFGYEQFYIIYCVYCRYSQQNQITAPLSELQLRSYNDFQFSNQFIKRVYQGIGKPLLAKQKFQFEDFIQMFLSDVCFDCAVSNHYMFKIGDVNEDGYIDLSDLGQFINQQLLLLEERGVYIEYKDLLMQFQDMIQFDDALTFRFTEKNILSCKMFMNFYDMMFSCDKFCSFENRDQYVGNSEIQQNKIVKTHCESGVWRAFWNAMYDQIAGE